MSFYEKFREEYGEYVVAAGDSLFKIAKENGVTVEEIMTLNNLASTTIYPNQILLIPNKINDNTYLTVNGDSLNIIATKAKTSIDKLMKMNSIYDYILVPNQEVKIKEDRTYIILPGDTIEGIAQKYNISIKDLISQNIDSWFTPGKTINV